MTVPVTVESPAPRYRAFGLVIQEARLQHGVTQEELAAGLVIPVSMIRQYEQGHCLPSAIRLLIIMIALNIAPSRFDEVMPS